MLSNSVREFLAGFKRGFIGTLKLAWNEPVLFVVLVFASLATLPIRLYKRLTA